jgi:hypothetical protein
MNAVPACLSAFALFSALSATGSAMAHHKTPRAIPRSTSRLGDGASLMPSAGANAFTSP